ncbi:MAG: undecaprenyl-phosphate glucose phosphotransferase [Proteobacteria bacterium]|nr:MAG: undecaprenyl-phosphate glucose phosphotransferase [Pseudomonadota bacterium]
MLKQKRQLFELLFMGADLFVVSCAWILAYWIRFETEFIPADKGTPPLSDYLPLLLFIWLIWAFVFRRMGLYRPMRGVRRSRELWQLIQANIFCTLSLIAVTYLFREKSVPFSRLVFVYFGALCIILTAGERSLLRYFLREVRRRGYNLRYMLVVGSGKVASDLVVRVRMQREIGIQLLGCLTRKDGEIKEAKGVPIIGSYEELPDILRRTEIDQVVVALPLEDNHYLPSIMSALKDTLVDVKIVPDVYQFATVGAAIEEFEGLPVISIQESPIAGFHRIAKRAFDILLAGGMLILLSPVMLLIAALIKLTSKGPIFYSQERVSVDGSKFKIFKFRTMRVDAEADGPQWSKSGDERITGLGRFLRRYSLDELPQLLNVLGGQMSIVGPRPERPVFIQEFRKRVPRYMLRHKVPAGMTGWAQVHGWRGDTSIDKRIEYDLYYIENWSLFLDLKILFLTLFRGIHNKGAC